ncbi:MAG: endolytic transglycosylase MltG [Patescibacteria group bacterium]|nr:endolytic transglycosylase MltG [Patescibacteria group bacterium]
MLAQNREIEKRKKNSKRLIIVGSILGVLFLSLFVYVSYVQSVINGKNSDDSTSVSVTIESGEGLEEISRNLEEVDVIRDDFIFALFLKFKGEAGSVQAGDYEIARNLSMIEVADIITKGSILEAKITIPEGWTIEKIADRLAANNVVSKADFLAATQKDYNYDFLTGKPAGTDLEGYLYPDTYYFDNEETGESVVQKMLDNFEKKYTTEIAAKVKIDEMDLNEVLTLASIVEREVSDPADRKKVSSVFLNRLSINMALESCATIQYITGESKTQFTYEETRVESPYNTYINRGLPPGPIGNPSMDSVLAVLDPASTDYLYFLSADGTTYFSYTLDEHERKKAEYLD